MNTVAYERRACQLSVDELGVRLSRRLAERAVFSTRVYCDEPIIMTGRQLCHRVKTKTKTSPQSAPEVENTDASAHRAGKSVQLKLGTAQDQSDNHSIHIDFERLASLRAASEKTCIKLIVDEEMDLCGKAEKAQSPQAAPPAPAFQSAVYRGPKPSERDSNESYDGICPQARAHVLTDDECTLLARVLAGKDVRAFEARSHALVLVLADSINDKLFDMFSDVCLEAVDGEGLCVVEDYKDALKEIVSS